MKATSVTLQTMLAATLLAGILPAAYAAKVAVGNNPVVNVSEGNIKLSATLEKLSPTCPAAASWSWGSVGACPDQHLGALAITSKGEAVFVPYSAFADLGAPNSIELKVTGKKGYVVNISGGDAGASYNATLKFQNGLLLERAVHHGEFKDEVWEKTTYKFNTSNR